LKDGGENEMNKKRYGTCKREENDDEVYQCYKLLKNLQAAVIL